jgi:hypothetical protein
MTRNLKLRIVDLKLPFGAKQQSGELVLYNNGDKEAGAPGRLRGPKSRKRKPRSR